MVVFDTSILVLSLDPDNARPPKDPRSGKALTHCKARIDYLIERLSASGTSILVPTPVLSEYLIKAGPNKYEYANKIVKARHFVVADFNLRAAIELTMLADADLSNPSLNETATKAKIRFDRQIVAISKANGAQSIYTCDEKLARFARVNGIHTAMAWDLPEPPPAEPDLFPA